MNRLDSHFNALGFPAIPQADPYRQQLRRPSKHENCYQVFRFNPQTADCTSRRFPLTVEHCPDGLDRKDVKPGRRYHDFLGAFSEAVAFNRPRLPQGADITPPTEWASILWHEGAAAMSLGWRVVTPLRYALVSIRPPRDWRPRTCIDPPLGAFQDEGLLSDGPDMRTLDEVVAELVAYNREWQPGRKRPEFWAVAVAIEADPAHESTVLVWNGHQGQASTHSVSRFHVITSAWPMSEQARELVVKGGAA